MSSPEFLVLRRAVLLRRVENALALGVARQVVAAYAKLEALLRARPFEDVSEGRRRERLAAIDRRAGEILHEAYRDIRATTTSQLTQVASQFGRAAVEEVTRRLIAAGVALPPLRLPTAAQFRELVRYNPIHGATLGQWWREFERKSVEQFRRTVTDGMMRRQTTNQIVRRVRGLVLTRGAGRRFRGGAFEVAHRDAQVLVRTAVHDVGNGAAVIAYKQNARYVQGVEWLATLDDRTCPECGQLDGREWPLDAADLRRPPAHPQCRCTVIPVVIGTPRRPRVVYDQWLAEQSAAVQDAILGKRRGLLYRRHKIPLDRLIREDGTLLPLDRLQARLHLPTDG